MLLNVARPSVVPPVPSPVTADGSPASLVPLPLPSRKTVQPPRYGSVAPFDPFALRSWYLYTFNVPVLRVLVMVQTIASPSPTGMLDRPVPVPDATTVLDAFTQLTVEL